MDAVANNSTQELHFGRAVARYSLNAFGEISFLLQSPDGPERKPSFSLGAQDFLIRGELGAHIVATTEFAVEFGDDNRPGVDLERLHVRWESEHFFVQAGRSHAELGYWNNAYHHGHWLQPTTMRPRWVAFEDENGLLPMHMIGVVAGASGNVGEGKLRAVVSVSNGRGHVQDDVRNEFDYSGRKAFHAMLESVGVGARDLRFGVSGVYERIPGADATIRPALPDTPIDEFIAGAHIAYPSVPWLLIAEAYYVQHRAAGHSFGTMGGFGVVGYSFGMVTPYVEAARVISQGGADPFYIPDPSAGQTSLNELDVIGGLRIDVSDWSALKLEYRNARLTFQEETPRHLGIVNWSWGF